LPGSALSGSGETTPTATRGSSPAPARSILSDDPLEIPVLLHRENLLDPPPQRRGGRHQSAPESLKLPGPLGPIHIPRPNLVPQCPHLLRQGLHVLVHHGFQFVQLGKLVGFQLQVLLMLKKDV
jgi:hypothetical protein